MVSVTGSVDGIDCLTRVSKGITSVTSMVGDLRIRRLAAIGGALRKGVWADLAPERERFPDCQRGPPSRDPQAEIPSVDRHGSRAVDSQDLDSLLAQLATHPSFCSSVPPAGARIPDAAPRNSPRTISHAEPRMPDGFDGGGWPADLNVCRALPTEEIEQQLARTADDANRGSPAPGSDDTVRPRPLELEPCAV